MSRLVEQDVYGMTEKLEEYDKRLRAICGGGLAEIARNAANTARSPSGMRVCVVPITAGLGIIGGFCEAVAGIVRYLGADATVTENTDVKGLWAAVESKCDIAFLADDNTFTAIHFAARSASDNSEATGRGFAAVLDMAARGISGKDTLVLGAGPVGTSAVAALHARGAAVSVFDIDSDKALGLAERYAGMRIWDNLPEALQSCSYLLDATPARGFLHAEMLREDAILAAPGVPLGVADTGLEQLEHRLIHDVLEIGVATMLFDVL